MLLKVFAVFDAGVGAYGAPICVPNSLTALRSFTAVCLDVTSVFAQAPQDFSLMELASYDPTTGRFENLTAPVMVTTALQVRAEMRKES